MWNLHLITYSGFVLIGHFSIAALVLKIFRRSRDVQLFEQIILSSLFGAIFLGLAIWAISRKKSISVDQRSFMMWVLMLSMLLMFFFGPNTVMNIDRSRSFYVLSWVGNSDAEFRNGQLSLSNVESSEKLNIQSIQERIDEQTKRGLIELRGEKYILTRKGILTLSLANRVANFYQLEGWFKNRD